MRRCLSLLALLPLALATAAQAGWSYRSPEGTVGLSIAKAGIRLLLGTSQGLQVSDDDGASWSRLGSLPRWSQVNEIRVDPMTRSTGMRAITNSCRPAREAGVLSRLRRARA